MVSKDLAGYGLSALIGDVVNVGFTIHDFADSRKQGNNLAVSTGKAATSFIAGEVYYSSLNKIVSSALTKVFPRAGGLLSLPATAALMMGQAGVSLMGAKMENTSKVMSSAYSHKGKFGSGYFNMTEAGYTMRQRSLNAIRSNGLNTQSVLGNEARTYYRGAV